MYSRWGNPDMLLIEKYHCPRSHTPSVKIDVNLGAPCKSQLVSEAEVDLKAFTLV